MLSDSEATSELLMHNGTVWHRPLSKRSQILCIVCVSLAKQTDCPSLFYIRLIIVFFLILNHEFWLKVTCRYVVLSHSYLSLHYKVVYVHVSGEVNSNNVYRSAFSAVALYRIGWKFVNNFESCSRKNFWFFWRLLCCLVSNQSSWSGLLNNLGFFNKIKPQKSEFWVFWCFFLHVFCN